VVAGEVLAPFWYLSGLCGLEADEAAVELGRVVGYFGGELGEWYRYYLDYYKTFDRFPNFGEFAVANGYEGEPCFSVVEAGGLWRVTCAIHEGNALAARFIGADMVERRRLVGRLGELCVRGDVGDGGGCDVGSFDVEGAFVRRRGGVGNGVIFPVKAWNELLVVREGYSVTLMGCPGVGKSACALGTVYTSAMAGVNCLYIYLENVVGAYVAELLSRHSWVVGRPVENVVLKRGFSEDDAVGVGMVRDLKADFDGACRGRIKFMGFSEFDGDPVGFGRQLAGLVGVGGYGLVVFDHLQRLEAYVPGGYDGRSYMNAVCRCFNGACLGGLGGGGRPFVGLMLVQPNKAAVERIVRSRGERMSMNDVMEASAVVQDSFVILGVYSDGVMRAGNRMVWSILKNRDGVVSSVLGDTSYIPGYCMVGDVVGGAGLEFGADILDGLGVDAFEVGF